MPYITKSRRADIAIGGEPQTAGELTFVLQLCLKDYLDTHDESYAVYAAMLGALEGAKLDLIERKIKPYEAKKREENGDVW